MQNLKKYTLREIKGYGPKLNETFEEKITRFFGYVEIKKDVEENLGLLKEIIEERVLEDYVEKNYHDDIVDLQEMFKEGEITEEELLSEIERLKEEAKYEMESPYQDPETKVIAGYKNRNSFKWLDGMNIILAKAGFLTRTKRITSSLAKQVDLASFEKQSSERYAKIYENYTASKEEKEALKQIEEYRKEIKMVELRELELEELMQKFKIEKEKQSIIDGFFDDDQKSLIQEMTLKNLEFITNQDLNEQKKSNGVDVTELVDRKMTLNQGKKEYDNEAIAKGEFVRPLLVFVSHDEKEDKLNLYDYVMEKEYEISEGQEILVMGQKYSKDGSNLIVEGMYLKQKFNLAETTKRKTAKLKDKFKKYVEEEKGYFLDETIPITGEQLLMAGDFISAEIKELIEEGELDYKEVKKNRELSKASVYFEVIEEHKNEARRNMMKVKNEKAINKKIEENYELQELLGDLEGVY